LKVVSSMNTQWQENEMAVIFSDDSTMPESHTHYPPLSEHEQRLMDCAVDKIMAKHGL